MDVPKLPASVLPSNQQEAPPLNQRVAGEMAAAVRLDKPGLEQLAAALDRADIRPLDIPAGLQILLAETRSAFDRIAESIGTAFVATADFTGPSPVQTAREIVELLLQALPDDPKDAEAWTASLARADSALEQGLQRATLTITNWRDISPQVVDVTKQSIAVVLQVLGDERPNPLWLRPEWVGLAPRLERLWRRRRASRRRLTDPDHWKGSLDEDAEP